MRENWHNGGGFDRPNYGNARYGDNRPNFYHKSFTYRQNYTPNNAYRFGDNRPNFSQNSFEYRQNYEPIQSGFPTKYDK